MEREASEEAFSCTEAWKFTRSVDIGNLEGGKEQRKWVGNGCKWEVGCLFAADFRFRQEAIHAERRYVHGQSEKDLKI